MAKKNNPNRRVQLFNDSEKSILTSLRKMDSGNNPMIDLQRHVPKFSLKTIQDFVDLSLIELSRTISQHSNGRYSTADRISVLTNFASQPAIDYSLIEAAHFGKAEETDILGRRATRLAIEKASREPGLSNTVESTILNLLSTARDRELRETAALTRDLKIAETLNGQRLKELLVELKELIRVPDSQLFDSPYFQNVERDLSRSNRTIEIGINSLFIRAVAHNDVETLRILLPITESSTIKLTLLNRHFGENVKQELENELDKRTDN